MKNKTKRTLKNIIHYLELKGVHYKNMEKWLKGKGEYDHAENWKRKRWEIEDLIEILNNEEKFNSELEYLEIAIKLNKEDAE